MKKKVSVVITTYKRPNNLVRAIHSVLNQTYKNIEIIIVNDDPDIDIKKLIPKDERIKYIKHTKNKGGSAARNTGIKNSNGAYIAFLDDDDYYLPEKIEVEVAEIEKLPEEWVGSICWSYYETGKVRKCFWNDDLIFRILSLDRSISLGSSSIFIKKKVVEEINGFDEKFPRHQDFEFLIRLSLEGKLKLIQVPLFIKYINENPPSADKVLKSKKIFLKKFEDLINSFDDKKVNKIFSSHWFEVSQYYTRECKFSKGLKFLFKSLTCFPPSLQLYKYIELGLIFLKAIRCKINIDNN